MDNRDTHLTANIPIIIIAMMINNSSFSVKSKKLLHIFFHCKLSVPARMFTMKLTRSCSGQEKLIFAKLYVDRANNGLFG